MGVKLAAAFGAEVTVFSTSRKKETDAKRLGASHFIATNEPDALKNQGGQFDFILDTVSAPHDINSLVGLLRRGGTMTLVGVPPETIRIGTREWKIWVGSGHSPEHVCLVDEAGGVMIAGDQVLPRITSNVSVTISEPEGDPLGEWLASITKFRTLPDSLFVLPAHGEPFYGLHARLDRLESGHVESLDRLHRHIAAEPRRAVDCFGVLFKRTIDDSIRGLATGEALAHLRHLEVTARARRERQESVDYYSAI